MRFLSHSMIPVLSDTKIESINTKENYRPEFLTNIDVKILKKPNKN